MRQTRLVDWGLAALVGGAPVLPWGPRYLGFGTLHYTLVGTATLALFWLVVRILEGRREAMPGRTAPPGRAVALAWIALLVAATGALLVGLSREIAIGSSSFWALVGELPLRALRPYHMYAHPFYPLERWLVFVQGGVSFLVVRDLCLRATDPRRRARTVLGGWTVGFGVIAVLAVAQYVTEFQLHPIWVAYEPLVRTHATLDTPNMLASYLLLGLGATLALMPLGETRSGPARWLAATLVAVGLLALGTTMSRAAWLAFGVTVCVFVGFGPPVWRALVPALVQRRPGLARVTLGALALLAVGLIAGRVIVSDRTAEHYVFATPVDRVVGTLDPRVPLTTAMSHRVQWWGAALRMFADEPLVGVGLGRYPRLVETYATPGTPRENAHSIWLQVLAEAGLVGLTALLLLVGQIVWTLHAASRRVTTRASTTAAGCLFGIVAFLITCSTEHQLLLGSGQTALATLVAAGVVASSDDGEPPGAGSSWSRRAWLGVIALSLIGYPLAALGGV